ncbi:uncharacterized protein LOC142616288 [Castanea sativa]|uniref:uncharacterized protein LOC142616288 n=1 Tax=Castanea sativa TaxID=21020 RepID=UPI003F649569
MTQGFWWPQMRKEATEYAQRCEQCQVHAPMIYQSAGNLNPVCSPWPFTCWGLDIVKPFSRATGNRRFVLVAVDYFIKWAEAEALANIRDVDVKRFVWRNIITRFNVPKSLISDNGLSTGETPFSLTYGAEAVIPAEVNVCSARVAGFASDENKELMAKELNLLEEHRDMATIRLAEYQQKLARRYNRAIKRREFAAGDLGHTIWRIWRKNHSSGHGMFAI